MDAEGHWGGKIAHFAPVSDCCGTIKGKAFEMCLWAYKRLGNGFSASMPIGLLAQTDKTAMKVPVTTDPQAESDIVIYISAEYQSIE